MLYALLLFCGLCGAVCPSTVNLPAGDRLQKVLPLQNLLLLLTDRSATQQGYFLSTASWTDGTLSIVDRSDSVGEVFVAPSLASVVFKTPHTLGHDLVSMNADGSGRVQISSNVFVEEAVSFSPDGMWVAYIDGIDGRGKGLYAARPGLGQQRRLSLPSQENKTFSHILWSPSSANVTFMVDDDLYVATTEAETAVMIASKVVPSSVSFKSDGTAFAYCSNVSPTERPFFGAFSRVIAEATSTRLDDEDLAARPDVGSGILETVWSGDDSLILLRGRLEPVPLANRSFLYAALPDEANSTYRFDEIGSLSPQSFYPIPDSSNVTWVRDGVLLMADAADNTTDANVILYDTQRVTQVLLSKNGSFAVFTAGSTTDAAAFYISLEDLSAAAVSIPFPGYIEYIMPTDTDEFIFSYNDGASHARAGPFYGPLSAPATTNSESIAVLFKQPGGSLFAYRTYVPNEIKVTCLN